MKLKLKPGTKPGYETGKQDQELKLGTTTRK